MIKKYQNSEHAICVLNHRGDLDWMIGWVMIERAGMLGVSLCSHYAQSAYMHYTHTLLILYIPYSSIIIDPN